MDIDRGLIASALRERSLGAFHGISDDMIRGDAASAFVFTRDHFLKFQKFPGTDLIWESTGINLIDGVNLSEPSGFFREKIIERHLFEKAHKGVMGIASLLERIAPVKDIKASISQLLFSDLTHSSITDTEAKSIFANPDALLDDYAMAQQLGITGIETPWPTMNRMTMGFQKQDFTLFVARPGVGKTWVLLICLLHAWKMGAKVIFFSTEMSEMALKRRVATLFTHLSYSKIKTGRLNDSDYAHLKKEMEAQRHDTRFLIVGNDTTLKRSVVEQNLTRHKPDLVAIDGFYMLEDDIVKYSANEKQAGIWKSGKQIAKTHNIPLLVSHQLNRPEKGTASAQNQKPDLSRLAYSDATGQYADYVFGIRQTEEMALDKKIQLIPMKARDSEKVSEIEINWDIENSLYSEVDRSKILVTGGTVTEFRKPQLVKDDVPF